MKAIRTDFNYISSCITQQVH